MGDGALADGLKESNQGSLTSYQSNDHGFSRAADRISLAVKAAILDGFLAPGYRLRESDLATDFGVSRTPVREALNQLCMEGLVELTPNQGATVTRLSTEDILAIYLVRESLEGLAARLCTVRATPQDYKVLQSLVNEIAHDTSELTQNNLRFHAEIRRVANNPYLNRFLSQIEHAVLCFGRTTFSVPGRREASFAEHSAIVEAIVAGDILLAEQRAAAHVRSARQVRVSMLLESIA